MVSPVTLEVEINSETMLKLQRRAARIGMTADEAIRVIVSRGAEFFLGLLVGATMAIGARSRKLRRR